MTDEARPDGHRTNILVIPLPDARPRPRSIAPDLYPVSGPVRAPASDPVDSAPDIRMAHLAPVVRPPAPIPDAPAPSSEWMTGSDDEDAVGQWYVTRPLTAAPPRPRTRATAPTGRGHLTAFAIAIPAMGATGILVTVIDTISTALAAALPIVVFLGAAAAWLFLSRLGAWVRTRIGALVAVLRR